MPSTECNCFVCDKFVSYQHICGHIMTHKNELVPLIVPGGDLFTTLRHKDNQEEYHCCFGCKKMLKDKTKMRQHMKNSEECCTKHKQFLKDIGVDVDIVEKEQNNNSDNKIIKGLQAEIDGLRSLLEDYKEGYQIKNLERRLTKAERHIRRRENFDDMIVYLLSEDKVAYCNEFISLIQKNERSDVHYNIKKGRKQELVQLIHTDPLLQFWFQPSYKFESADYNSEGAHEGLLCKRFENLGYTSPDMPSDVRGGKRVAFPIWKDMSESEKRVMYEKEEVLIPTPEQILQVNNPPPNQPKLIGTTKRVVRQV